MKDKVLLIGPRFFGYELEIEKEINTLGYNCIYIDDRPSNNTINKALLRFFPKFYLKKINNYFKSKFSTIKDIKIVFVYNPEAITIEWLVILKEQNPKAIFKLYLWDSFENKPNFKKLHSFFDSKFSFDKTDAIKYSLEYLPLFYSNCFKKDIHNDKYKYDISFIGTGHSDRYSIVKKMIETNQNYIHSKYLYFYLQSKLMYLYFKLRDKNFKNSRIKDFKFKSILLADTAKIIHDSKCVIDINHPNQRGLTMRTLEVLGSQTKLITTNSEILKEDFYHTNNILVINRINSTDLQNFMELDYVEIDKSINEKYSINSWIKTILFN